MFPLSQGVTGIEPLQLMILPQPKDDCPVRLERLPVSRISMQIADADAGAREKTGGNRTPTKGRFVNSQQQVRISHCRLRAASKTDGPGSAAAEIQCPNRCPITDE